MATDTEQLAFEVAVPATSVSEGRDEPATEPDTLGCLTSGTLSDGGLVALAVVASRADPGIASARLLLQLAAAVDAAIAVSISDAHAEHRSWRKLSAMLDLPFQTLHRRYGARTEGGDEASSPRRRRTI